MASSVRIGSPGNGSRARSTISGAMRRMCQCEAAAARYARRSAASTSVSSPRVTARMNTRSHSIRVRSEATMNSAAANDLRTVWCGAFVEKPGHDGAGLGVQVHLEPRSSSRSCAALCLPGCLRGNALYRPASPGEPSVARPRLAKARSPAGTDASICPCPGGENSATTSPRSVTSTLSPARTSRRYSLRRFLSSRMPTVFTDGNVAT